MPSRNKASLGILAGGRGLRLGGVDKAFLKVEGKLQLQRILDSMTSGFASILISYNDAPPSAPEWPGLRWVSDERADFQGPLAGLESLLCHTQTPWLLTVPVDIAWPSRRIAGTLLAGKGGRVIEDADGCQPLVALWPVAPALVAVRQALDRGERAVHAVHDRLGLERISIAPQRIGNLNTPQDLDLMP